MESASSVAVCPQCHFSLQPTFYFCPNCGKKIKIPPPVTTVVRQILLYLGAIALPPLGLYWGWPYIRQTDTKSKIIGIVTIVLTILSFVITSKIAIDYVSKAADQAQQQLNQMQGF